MQISKCAKCGQKKSKFVAARKQKGTGDVVDALGKYVGELHLRTAPSLKNPLGQKYSFCGPGTRLDKRLGPDDKPLPHSLPINRVDSSCYKHDIAYRDKSKAARHAADQVLLNDLAALAKMNPTPEEARATRIIRPIITAKKKFGLGKRKAKARPKK